MKLESKSKALQFIISLNGKVNSEYKCKKDDLIFSTKVKYAQTPNKKQKEMSYVQQNIKKTFYTSYLLIKETKILLIYKG